MKSKEFELLRTVLNEIGWSPEEDKEDPIFYVDFGEPHKPVSDALAVVAADTQRFLFYIDIGPAASVNTRDEVVLFIALVNWSISIGNFEMNYEDGNVRFRSSVGFGGAELSASLMQNAIRSAMHVVEVCGPALVEVIEGSKEAQDAFAHCQEKLSD